MLDDSPIDHAVEVDAGDRHVPARGFDAQPPAEVRSVSGDAGSDPVTLSDLLLDGEVEIRKGLSNTQDMSTHGGEASRLASPGSGLATVRRDEVSQAFDVAGIDDFFDEPPSDQLVSLSVHG